MLASMPHFGCFYHYVFVIAASIDLKVWRWCLHPIWPAPTTTSSPRLPSRNCWPLTSWQTMLCEFCSVPLFPQGRDGGGVMYPDMPEMLHMRTVTCFAGAAFSYLFFTHSQRLWTATFCFWGYLLTSVTHISITQWDQIAYVEVSRFFGELDVVCKFRYHFCSFSPILWLHSLTGEALHPRRTSNRNIRRQQCWNQTPSFLVASPFFFESRFWRSPLDGLPF